MTQLLTATAPSSGVHLLNFSAEDRSNEFVSFNVPFAQGTYHGEPLWDPGTGLMLQWQETGLRWPDGSIRHVCVHLPVSLSAGQRVRLASSIVAGQGKLVPFDPIAFAAFSQCDLVVQCGTSQCRPFRDGHARFLENGWACKALVWTARMPNSPLVVEAIVEFKSGQLWADLSLQVKCFGVQPQLVSGLPDVEVYVRGARFAVRHPERKILEQKFGAQSGDQTIRWLQASNWSAGESQTLWGPLLLPGPGAAVKELAIAQGPIIAVADNWAATKAYGPLGALPTLPASQVASAAARAKADYDRHPTGDPWFGPVLGPDKAKPEDPSADLVAAACVAEAQGVAIERLRAVELSVGQLSCFGNHYCDAAGDPIQFTKFPQAVFWTSVPHWTSPNLFGLPAAPSPVGSHGFACLDDEHAQGAHAIALATLTGWRWLRRELDHQLEVQLQCMNTMNGAYSPVVPHLLAARGEARMFRRAWGIAKAIGRSDALPWLRNRLVLWGREWAGGSSIGPVTPLKTGQDPRRANNQRCWSWEEGEPSGSAAGFVMEQGTKADLELLYKIAKSWVTYGVLQGTPVSEAEWVVWLNGQVGGQVHPQSQADFLPWGATTLQWTLDQATQRGDTQVAGFAKAALVSLGARPFNWETFEYQAGGQTFLVTP